MTGLVLAASLTFSTVSLVVLFEAPGALAECGDGVLDGSEECDDGDLQGLDCCSADCTFQAAYTLCDHGESGSCLERLQGHCDGSGSCFPEKPGGAFPYAFAVNLALNDRSGEDQDTLAWSARRSGFGAPGLPGDPTLDTEYTFCVYAVTYGSIHHVDRLVYERTIPPGAGWRAKRNGWIYRSDEGRGRVKLSATPFPRFRAKGTAAELPGPESDTRYFDSVSDQNVSSPRAIYFGLFNSAGLHTVNHATRVRVNTADRFRGFRPHTYD
jgi:cysteine-rich repeat protein